MNKQTPTATIGVANPTLGYARECSLCHMIRSVIMLVRYPPVSRQIKINLCAFCALAMVQQFLPQQRKKDMSPTIERATSAPAKRAGTTAAKKRKPR